jgi:hypothetical protein
MTKSSSGDALSKIIEQLQQLEVPDRDRVMRAVLSFFGISRDLGTDDIDGRGASLANGNTGRIQGKQGQVDAKGYFDRKQPQSKIEELAVAARFREEIENVDNSSQEELRAVFGAARRTFDAHNFNRDLDNARTKGLFMRGTGRDSVQLSSYGQGLVDVLPDREKAKALSPKAKRRGARKKPLKKAKA